MGLKQNRKFNRTGSLPNVVVVVKKKECEKDEDSQLTSVVIPESSIMPMFHLPQTQGLNGRPPLGGRKDIILILHSEGKTTCGFIYSHIRLYRHIRWNLYCP